MKTIIDSVRTDLKKGKRITGVSAFRDYGTTRVASVICELRKQGMKVKTEKVNHKPKRGGTVVIARYSL